MKSMLIIPAALMAVTFSACTPQLQPYTSQLHYDMRLDEEALQRVQFYVSNDIVLQRELRATETNIQRGRLEVVNGRRVEEVLIPAGTPGQLVYRPASSSFAISFESDDEAFLIFGDREGNFELLAKEWKNRIGKVTYAGQDYYTAPESAGAILLVDVRKLNRMEVSSRQAEGRRVY